MVWEAKHLILFLGLLSHKKCIISVFKSSLCFQPQSISHIIMCCYAQPIIQFHLGGNGKIKWKWKQGLSDLYIQNNYFCLFTICIICNSIWFSKALLKLEYTQLIFKSDNRILKKRNSLLYSANSEPRYAIYMLIFDQQMTSKCLLVQLLFFSYLYSCFK